MTGKTFFTHWYLHGPNFLIIALMCLLLARLALSYVPHRNGVTRTVSAVTHPVTLVVGAITPRIIPPRGVILLSIAWLLVARAALLMAALARGVQL